MCTTARRTGFGWLSADWFRVREMEQVEASRLKVNEQDGKSFPTVKGSRIGQD